MASWEESTVKIYELANLYSAMVEASTALNPRPYWRGPRDENWALRPRVFRSPSIKANESSLLWHFVMRGSPRTRNAPSFDDKIGWIHLAQHFGLPTRLLDWSHSPFTALYFAVCNEDHDDKDGCLWTLNPIGLNEQQSGERMIMVPNSALVEGLINPAFDANAFAKPAHSALAIAAGEIDLRMLVQQAAFTIHRDGDDMRNLAADKQIMRKFLIPKASKTNLRGWLRVAGFSEGTIFPDLAGLANDIRNLFDYPLSADSGENPVP